MLRYFQGERKRKSVRGCIVDGNLAVLNLAIVKKGEAEIPGLTDNTIPRRLGPKRASKIRKLFNLTKVDDVRKYVNTYRQTKEKDGKKQTVLWWTCLLCNSRWERYPATAPSDERIPCDSDRVLFRKYNGLTSERSTTTTRATAVG